MPGRIEKTVFISYRRTNLPWARAIYQDLTSYGYDAFFDFQSLDSGDFSQIIIENIKARAHFILLLTPSALERCNDPTDWLRREIETAIEFRRNIVPLMLDNFDFGSPSVSSILSGKLASIKNYNGLRIYSDYFDEGLDRLRNRFLNVKLDAVIHPVSITVNSATKEQQKNAISSPIVSKEELKVQKWLEQGNKEYEEKSFTDAINSYAKAIELEPNNALAYQCRGKAYWANKRPDNAIQDCDEAIRLKPNFAEAFNYRANARRDKADLDGAISDYTEAIRLDPNYAYPYYNRALAHSSMGNLDSAINDFTEAIRIDPNYTNAYNGRGNEYYASGNFDDAINDYTAAIRLDPNYANPYIGRGNVLYTKRLLDSAIREYTEAIRVNPESASAYYNRANTWKEKEDYYSAIADYQKYLDLGGEIKKVTEWIEELKKKIR